MKPVDTLDDDALSRLARRAAALPDAPDAAIAKAVALFEAARPSLAARAGDALRRIFATSSFDSWAVPALASGMRAAPSDTRHLLFSAEGRDIDLRVGPDADAAGLHALSGQILGTDESGRVELVDEAVADAVPHAIELDAFGEFRIAGLAAGRYRMTLRFGDDAIELPTIVVGPR